MESLLQDLGHPLRLSAIAIEALLRFEAAASAGFGVFFGGSCAGDHGVLHSIGVIWGLKSAQAHGTKVLPARLQGRVSSAPCAFHTSCFPLPALCGTKGPQRYPHSLTRILKASQ